MKEGCDLGILYTTNKQPSLMDLPQLRSKNYRITFTKSYLLIAFQQYKNMA
jgi:hypothetical protein